MTPKEQLDKLAVYLLAPKEEANVQLDYNEIALILSDVKQSLNEHEALKKDVARYFELAPKFKSITKEKQIECYQLQDKLSKVGKEK